MTGCTLGNYQLVEKLGEGGMGAVYKGLDMMVEREVAIKMLRPEIARQPDIVERFRAEAVALAKLNHPNIATLYSFFREGDEYFMVMEFVHGLTLESVIRDSQQLSFEQTVNISAQVLDAIEHAHSYGILHRDIKPANIMLTSSGQVKVTDFGIARVLGKARMTQDGTLCGTLEYLAPERIRGNEGDIRSDLYSMGIVLYEMLTRHIPFERDSAFSMMRAHLEEAPPPFAAFGLSSIPASLEYAVTTALAKAPEDRFATAADFRAALVGSSWKSPVTRSMHTPETSVATQFFPYEAEGDRNTSVSPVAPTGKLRWWPRAGFAAGVVLLLVALLMVYLRIQRQGDAKAIVPAAPPVSTQAPPVKNQAEPATEQPKNAEQEAPPAEQGPELSQPSRTVVNSPAQRPGDAASSKKAVEKKTPASKTVTEAERREAALKALGKDTTSNAAKKKKALEALKD